MQTAAVEDSSDKDADFDGVFTPEFDPFNGDQLATEESLAWAKDKSLEEQNAELHELRKSHAWLLFGLTVLWIVFVWIVILLQGFGQWFTPLVQGFKYFKFKLSDTVLIAFMTTTTATVLGLYGIAAYWLYGKPKGKDEKAEPEKEKKPSA